jgi:DNA-binding transcriptional ArsR family regulator
MTPPEHTGSTPAVGGDRSGPVTRLHLNPDAHVRITNDPYSAVLALACAGVRDLLTHKVTPAARLAARLPPEQRWSLAQIAAPGSSVSPDFLSPPWPASSTRVSEEVGRLRDLSVADLRQDFATTFGGDPPLRWQRVAERPRDWAVHLANAIDRLWTTVEPVWRREQDLRDLEAERIGSAVIRGALDTVLDALHPRGWAEDGRLVFPDPEGTSVDARDRAVVLAPGLSRLDVSISNLDRSDAVWLAYPVRRDHPPDPGGLAALLTPIRARLLQAIDVDRTMSDVAGVLHVSPATATHQVDALVMAGLAHRRRLGRRMLVRRTERGDRMLALYALRQGPSGAP